MGGICGFVGLDGESLVKKMSQTLSHRGPCESIFIDKNVGLCSRDIDEEGLGRNEDGTIQVVLDGELFNLKELWNILKRKGHKLSSCSKSEVTAHLYEEYGKLAVNKLRGSFSLALWNQKRKMLLLARDREGEKSIFYTISKEALCFASEIQTLLHCGLTEKKLNPVGLDYYFSWGHVPAPETLFEDIKKLPPAHYLMYKENRATLHKYWNLDFSKIEYGINEEEWYRRIYNMLIESISIRLPKGPIGILLGGLDSSAMAAMMKKLTDEPLMSFTINFENEEFNEPYAKYVAEWLGIEAYEKTLEARDAIRIIPKLVHVFDDLRIDSVITLPTFLALTIAKEKVGTVFTADGADCTFWSWGWGPSKVQKPKLTSAVSNLRNPQTALRAWRIVANSVRAKITSAHLPRDLRPLYNSEYYHENELKELLGRSSTVNVYAPFLECLKYPADNLGSKIRKMCLKNKEFEVIGGWGVERLGTICSHFQLGLRTPFEDHKLKELAARIPPLLKQPDEFSDKYIFRKMLLRYSILPKEVVKQRKWGFGWGLTGLIANWFRGELREYVEQTVAENIDMIKPVLNEGAVMKYSKKGRPLQILSLLTFVLWYKRFFT